MNQEKVALKKLVLVGAGHALLPTIIQAKYWVQQGVEVHLITANPYLYYSGMLPEWFGDVYSIEEIRIPVQQIAEENGIFCVIDEFESIIPKTKIIQTKSGKRISYDLIAFAIGATTATKTEFENEFPVKPFSRLIELKHAIAQTVEQKKVRLGIVGGGAAGVEIALNLSARYNRDQLEISLFDRHERFVSRFPKVVSTFVEKLFKERNVNVQLKSREKDLNVHSYDFVMNATGVRGISAFQQAGLATDISGFLRVNQQLQSISSKEIFAAGDCATIDGLEFLPKIGVHAVSQGQILANNLEAELTLRKWIQHGSLASKSFTPRRIAGLILSTGGAEGIWTTEKWSFIHPCFLQFKHEVDLRWISQYQPTIKKLELFDRLHLRHAIEKKPILNALKPEITK